MTKLLRYFKPYRGLIALILVFTLIQVWAVLELPYFMSNMVDIGIVNKGVADPTLAHTATKAGQLSYILKTGGLMVGVALISVIFSVSAGNLASRISAGLARDLRGKIFEKVENFSLAEIDRFSISSLIIRSTNDIAQVQQITFMLFRPALVAPMNAIGALIMASRTDIGLSWILAATLPLLFVFIGGVGMYAMPLFKKQQQRNDQVNLVAREGLTGVRVIRAFNRIATQAQKFNFANVELTDLSKRVNSIMAVLMPVMGLIVQLVFVAILWFGADRIASGSLSIGSLMAYLQYAMQIMMGMMMISMVLMMYPRAAVSANRINEVLEAELVLHDGAHELSEKITSVEFQKVGFSFPNAEESAIHDISFRLNEGETTAIIGSTGSGKSTILNLILRLYDASEGRVLINGRAIQDYKADSLRSRIGYTPQRALLFSGSIADNIRIGKEDASEEEIWRALEIAQARNFIAENEEGLAAEVSQGGTNFSGGQKQRLAVARAIISEPELFLFDDTFSALDATTEKNLREALAPLTSQSITLIVSQRISSITKADQIILLDQGTIIGLGTHDELLAENAVYQEIARSQNFGGQQ